MLGNQGNCRVKERLAFETALVHVGNPLVIDRAGKPLELGRFSGAKGHDAVATVGRRFAANGVIALLCFAKPGRRRHAGIGIDDFLQVSGQAVVSGLVHGHHEGGGVKGWAACGELGVELGELVHFDRGHHLPGDDAAFDRALAERVRNLRQWHAHRRGAY